MLQALHYLTAARSGLLSQLVVEPGAGAAAGAAGLEELGAALLSVLAGALVSELEESDVDEVLSPLLLGA